MSIVQDIGAWGEEIATQYLSRAGHEILKRNYRYSYAEVDIISMHEKVLTFVEVKTRSIDGILKAEETLSDDQIERILFAASQFMSEIEYEWIISLDLICIDYRDREFYTITHFANIDIGDEFLLNH